MANSTLGNLPLASTPVVGTDIIPISRDGTNLTKVSLTNLKLFTDNVGFSTIVVAGQSSVVADSASDTLTLVAGTNITLTTNATNDSIIITSTASGGGYTPPTYSTDNTVGKTIAAADLNTLIVYNSAATANFTIPDDATLSLSGVTNNSFEIYQKGTGAPSVIAGAGVTLNKWTGYPTSTQFVTQTVHRVGANTWAVK